VYVHVAVCMPSRNLLVKVNCLLGRTAIGMENNTAEQGVSSRKTAKTIITGIKSRTGSPFGVPDVGIL